MDGTVLLIEGLGRSTDASDAGTIIHNAFAVVSYDRDARVYRFRAYRANGNFVDAEASVAENTLVWGFRDARAGEIRFTIRLDERRQWVEIGELSRDGRTWQKFFEMTLRRSAE